jgi:mannose-6-phosphate isomerase-like protein (cupin superfamily)
MKMRCYLIAIFSALLLTATANAQKAAEVFGSTDIQKQLDQLLPASQKSGSSGATLSDGTTHALKLSVRSTSGGAEIHAHFDDVMVVLDGSATLITGGTVVDPTTDASGETKGKAIRDGVTRTVAKGDIIHVPAGTPHQLILAKDGTFSAFVVKVHE